MSSFTHILALPPGYVLESYRIERVLGEGGFGITYLAVDTESEKRVAIKELLPGDIATRIEGSTVVPKGDHLRETFEWALDNFAKEARALARLSHPNVVPIHRLFRANGTAYMVMDFVEGSSLRDWLKQHPRPSEEELRSILLPLLDGLEHVHEAGLLHRDIKPDNIFITAKGRPVLLDFGSARVDTGRTQTMTAVVSEGYSPFEQYQRKARQAPATDLYSLAAVMVRAVTGEAPPSSVDRMAVEDEFPPVTESHAGKYSPAFLQAVDAAFAVKLEHRPQSVADWRRMFHTHPDRNGTGVRQVTARPVVTASAPRSHPAIVQASGGERRQGAAIVTVDRVEATLAQPPRAGMISAIVLGSLLLIGAVGWLIFRQGSNTGAENTESSPGIGEAGGAQVTAAPERSEGFYQRSVFKHFRAGQKMHTHSLLPQASAPPPKMGETVLEWYSLEGFGSNDCFRTLDGMAVNCPVFIQDKPEGIRYPLDMLRFRAGEGMSHSYPILNGTPDPAQHPALTVIMVVRPFIVGSQTCCLRLRNSDDTIDIKVRAYSTNEWGLEVRSGSITKEVKIRDRDTKLFSVVGFTWNTSTNNIVLMVRTSDGTKGRAEALAPGSFRGAIDQIQIGETISGPSGETFSGDLAEFMLWPYAMDWEARSAQEYRLVQEYFENPGTRF